MARMRSAVVSLQVQFCTIRSAGWETNFKVTITFSFQTLFLRRLLFSPLHRPASLRRFFVRVQHGASHRNSCVMDEGTVLMDLMKAAVWSSANTLVCHPHKMISRYLVGSSLTWFLFLCLR